MNLTQPEIIQILRRRSGLNQGDFGARAFGISLDSARTKIKNIELGRQIPTKDDLRKMALALGVGMGELEPITELKGQSSIDPEDGFIFNVEALRLFPGLKDYIEMLNKAAKINDHELIAYLAGRISALFAMMPKREAASR